MDGQIRLTVDGGWAWLVCAACFSIQFVVFGVIQSYGTIFIALLKEFKSGESETGKYLRLDRAITYGLPSLRSLDGLLFEITFKNSRGWLLFKMNAANIKKN